MNQLTTNHLLLGSKKETLGSFASISEAENYYLTHHCKTAVFRPGDDGQVLIYTSDGMYLSKIVPVIHHAATQQDPNNKTKASKLHSQKAKAASDVYLAIDLLVRAMNKAKVLGLGVNFSIPLNPENQQYHCTEKLVSEVVKF